MLSRGQEARVRAILWSSPPGTIQTYCLDHLATAAKIPLGHLPDLSALVRSLHERGDCQRRFGGFCDADRHETRAHAGTITTARPDEMWGTDATRFYTEEDGWCWFFGAIDHCVDELVAWHTAKIGDRWAALEPLRQGVRHVFGGFAKDIARGLRIRCDWGPQYIADAWINEVKWLGMTITPSYVGEPECNGVIERFMRTLKEQCLYLHRFPNLAEARRIIAEFIARYNTEWLIERLGHQTPVAARAAAMAA